MGKERRYEIEGPIMEGQEHLSPRQIIEMAHGLKNTLSLDAVGKLWDLPQPLISEERTPRQALKDGDTQEVYNMVGAIYWGV